jgi:hypothetical protein
LAWANGVLVVADSSPFRVGADPQNNRVLIYKNLFGPGDPSSTTGPTQLPAATAEPVANNNSLYWWCPVCGGRADIVVGQTDFNGTAYTGGQNGLRTPTAVATDGVRLAIADTDNNRILLWDHLPTVNGQNADRVLGQPDFNTVTPNTGTPNVLIPAANTLRGPEGVWIDPQNGRLFVADTMNNRVLIWSSWPTANAQAANLVLGQPDFNTQTQGDLTKGTPPASATNMLNPASVTSDGMRVFVADLGQNRVLIWNSIPRTEQRVHNGRHHWRGNAGDVPDLEREGHERESHLPVYVRIHAEPPALRPFGRHAAVRRRRRQRSGADLRTDSVDPGCHARHRGERGPRAGRFHFRQHHR